MDGAFAVCTNLTIVTVGSGVTNIGGLVFQDCTSLIGVYFNGNAPTATSTAFYDDSNVIIYYLPGTTGWSATLGGARTWNPQAQKTPATFGVHTNQFGFNIVGNNNLSVIVQVCTNLAKPVWQSIHTNTLTGGLSYFSDSQWTNSRARYYRFRSP